MKWMLEDSDKFAIKIIICLSVISICFSGCDEYFLLSPLSYKGNVDYKIINNEILLEGKETVKIITYASGLKTDSTIYVFVELQVKRSDKKWENELLYSLVDNDDYLLKPVNVRRFDKDQDSEDLNYGYSIMFYVERYYIKLPIKFQMADINNKLHIITYNYENGQ